MQWSHEKKTVTLVYLQNDQAIQKIIIEFDDDGFEVKFGVKFPYSVDTGVFCFKNGENGFDSASWTDYFSPEADAYYENPPIIDVSATVDNQWIFTPAPLNISLHSSAGWFSVGLGKLAPITRLGLKNNGIWLNYPWKKLAQSGGEFFWLEPFVFTVNATEWDAVGDYRHYLKKHDYLTPRSGSQSIPEWWRQPLLSTWGEQVVLKITKKNPGYNSEWVKEYLTNQTALYGEIPFTIIIENQWQAVFGDASPAKRFHELKELITWCHQRGHKVVLWWKAWIAEANSLAQSMEIADGDFVDATHSGFQDYVRQCCQAMLANTDTTLNADGIKISELFRVREPLEGNYSDSSKGVGLQEIYLYLKTFYDQAKLIKPDALILSYAHNPFFQDVQDMVGINEDWDNKLRREKRARIITQALPGMLIDGDASDMSGRIALYHYMTSAIYANLSIEYYSKFQDDFIAPETQLIISKILELHQKKGPGTPGFVNYGWWQWRDKKNRVVIESIAKGTALLYYKGKSDAILLSALDQDVPFMLDKRRLLSVKNEKGNKVSFDVIGMDVYKLHDIQKNHWYKLKFRQTRR